MRVLMIGTMVPDKTKEYCFRMGQRTSAADSVQGYMLLGLDELDEVSSVDAIGAVRLKAWPKSKILHLENDFQKENKGGLTGIGYHNLPVFGFFLRERALTAAAAKWAKANRDCTDAVVLVYSMHSPFLKAAKKVKSIIPSAKIVLIVADLPLFMDMRGSVRRVLKKIDWSRIKSLSSCVDKYLLYTKYMAEYLGLEKSQWMTFEGLIDEGRVVTKPQQKYDESIVLYAGNLDRRYGIDTLIEAFGQVKSPCRLHIYGAGFDAARIETLVGPLDNVEYKGQVTQDEAFEIMKKSTLLINPRPAEIGLARFSCPSKTFEYMASGTPICMNRLPGLPEEYAQYVHFFREETPECYAETIDELISQGREALTQEGLTAAEFLRNEKNSVAVMKKVCEFVGW